MKIIKILTSLMVFCIIINSCITADGETCVTFYIDNKLKDTIRIIEQDAIKDTVIVPPLSFYKLGVVCRDGKSIHAGYGGIPFISGNQTLGDTAFVPVKVIIGKNAPIIHYSDTLKHTGNYLNRTSNRNLFNQNAFNEKVTKEEKYNCYIDFWYTFE